MFLYTWGLEPLNYVLHPKKSCKICPAGSECSAGILKACALHEFSPKGIGKCYSCPDGYTLNSTKDGCEICTSAAQCFAGACASDEYWLEGADACVKYPDGYNLGMDIFLLNIFFMAN